MAIVGYVEIILVAILCFCFFCHRRWNNENSALFTNWPLVGMLPGLLGNAQRVHECATQLLKQSGYTFEFKGPWSANMDFLLTSNVQNLQHILIKNFPNFQKGSAFKKIFDVLGDGILGAESDSWKTQRQLIHSLMKKSRFQRHLEKAIQQKVEKGLLPILEHVSKLGLEVDMQELFQRFTFDNSCMFMFGFDPGSLSIDFPEVSAAKAVNDIEEALINRHIVPECCWKLQRWIQIGEEKKLSRAREIFDRFIDHHVLLKRERRRSKTQKEEVDEEESFDLVTGFMEEEEKADTSVSAFKISNKFLRDLVWNLLAAGKETVSVTLAWFFWLVAMNPSVGINIREEIKAKLQAKEDEKWRVFNVQELNKLVYLHGDFCESLRLYPPVPFNHKSPVQADILPSGHHVDPDTMILISMYTVGRMEEVWGEDCLEFKPERWISETGGIKDVPSYKFPAFNAGPRSCLGKEISFIQMKTVATTIIWNYHVQVVEGHPVSPSISIILHMKHGLKVRITKRCVCGA